MRWIWISLLWFALLGSAAVLRLQGSGFLLPQRPGPDTVVLEQELRLLQSEDPSYERQHRFGLYPELLPILTETISDDNWEPLLAEAELDQHLSAAAKPRSTIRATVAWLSLISIPATFWIARCFLSPPWPWIAAALAAFSLLTQWYAQQGRPHGAASALLVLAVASALHLRRQPSWRAYLLCGLAVGIAAGALQYGYAALLCLACAIYRRETSSAAAHFPWPFGVLLAGMALALASWVFYSFPGADHRNIVTEAAKQQSSLVNLGGHALHLSALNGGGAIKTMSALLSYEPVLTLLALLALVGFRSWGKVFHGDLSVVLAFFVPYCALMLLYEGVYGRFLLPLVPFLAVAASAALARPRWPHWTRVTITATSVVFAFSTCVALWKLRTREDTLSLAGTWIREHIAPSSERILVLPSVTLPIFSTQAALLAEPRRGQDPSQPWHRYQHRLVQAGWHPGGGHDLRALNLMALGSLEAARADPEKWIDAQAGDYILIEVREGSGWSGLPLLRHAIRTRFDLVVRWQPDEHSPWRHLSVEYQDHEFPQRPWWFARVFAAERTGPVLELYRRRTHSVPK